MPKITIYTDGACRGNPGRGAWAALLIKDGGSTHSKEFSGVKAMTTNNEMELTAVNEALAQLKKPCEVTIYSDSAYIVNAFQQNWIANWQRNSWRTKSKSPVKNRELWESILKNAAPHDVEFRKVKGHAGDPGNERVDQLANEALDAM